MAGTNGVSNRKSAGVARTVYLVLYSTSLCRCVCRSRQKNGTANQQQCLKLALHRHSFFLRLKEFYHHNLVCRPLCVPHAVCDISVSKLSTGFPGILRRISTPSSGLPLDAEEHRLLWSLLRGLNASWRQRYAVQQTQATVQVLEESAALG